MKIKNWCICNSVFRLECSYGFPSGVMAFAVDITKGMQLGLGLEIG